MHGQMFADSSSLIVTFERDEGQAVEKSLSVVMIYGILTAGEPRPSLTFYYPMAELFES